MFERLAEQLKANHKHSQAASPHWALTLILAMSFTGWLVYQGVTQQVQAQAGIGAKFNAPIENEVLVLPSTYRMEFEYHRNALRPGDVLWIRAISGTASHDLFAYQKSVGEGDIVGDDLQVQQFNWDLSTLPLGFLSQSAYNDVRLVAVYLNNANQTSTIVATRNLRIYRWGGGSTASALHGWQTPAYSPQQTFGLDQQALFWRWARNEGSFLPPVGADSANFYRSVTAKIYYLNQHDSGGYPRINKVTITNRADWDNLSGVITVGPEAWGGSDPNVTLGLELVTYGTQDRGSFADSTRIDQVAMPTGQFVTWTTPSNQGLPAAVAGQNYPLKWSYNPAANPPSNLRADYSVGYYTPNNVWIIETIAENQIPGDGSFTWSVPDETRIRVGGTDHLTFLVKNKYTFGSTTYGYSSTQAARVAVEAPAVPPEPPVFATPSIAITTPHAAQVVPTGSTPTIDWTLIFGTGDKSEFVGQSMIIRAVPTSGASINIGSVPIDTNQTEYTFTTWQVPASLAGQRVKIAITIDKTSHYNGGTFESDEFAVVQGGKIGDGADPEDFAARYVSAKQSLFGPGQGNLRLTDIITVGANEFKTANSQIHYWVGLYNAQNNLLTQLPAVRANGGLVIDKTGLTDTVKQQAALIDVTVAFELTGVFATDELPKVYKFTVNYSTDFTNVPFTVTITPDTRTVDAGASASYTVNVIPAGSPTFSGAVNLAITNASWITGQVASTFTPAQVNVPGGATLTLMSTTPGSYTFAVSATSTTDANLVAVSNPAAVIVEGIGGDTVPSVVLNFTAPVQRGTIKNPTLPFTLSLYEGLQLVHKDTTTTNANDTGVITIPATGSPLQLNKTYSVYAKTPQHLSRKATQNLTVTQPTSGNMLTVDLTFQTLPAGDIAWGATSGTNQYDSWDKTDSTDWSQYLGELAGTLLTKLGDFNNDGDVNSLDAFAFIGGFSSYLQSGALRTDNINTPPN